MPTHFAKIQHFNRNVLKIEPRPLGLQADHEITLSHHQLCEEADEYNEALTVVDAVDALIDSLYYTYGILYKLGLTEDQVDQCVDAVHSCNMQKVLGKVAKRDYGDNADAVKPEDWVAPEEKIKAILTKPVKDTANDPLGR